jgi:hypothetical protein
VRWAAGRIYAADPERKARRQEELEAVIRKSIPTGIFALFFGLGFGCAGLYCVTIPRVPAALRAVWRKVCRSFDLEYIAMLFALAAGLEFSDSLNSLKAAGMLMGIAVFLITVQEIFGRIKSAADRRRLSRGSPGTSASA